MKKTPFVPQHDESDCGVACLASLLLFYKKGRILQEKVNAKIWVKISKMSKYNKNLRIFYKKITEN